MPDGTTWPLVGIGVGVLAAALAGVVWSAYAAVNQHQLQARVQAREGAARRIWRLLKHRQQLEFLLQATMVAGIAIGTAAALQLQPLASVRGLLLLWLVVLLLISAVQLGIRAGRHYSDAVCRVTCHVLLPLQRALRPLLELVLPTPAEPQPARAGSTTDSDPADAVRALLAERSDLPASQARMLRGVLDLSAMRVREIMVPRSEINGIDLDLEVDALVETLRNARHTRLPVYRSDVNNVVGLLHLRDAHEFVSSREPTRALLLSHAAEPYFVPEGTRLDVLLHNLQHDHRRLALVVDEYGDLVGLVTVDDVLEQIVGEYTTDFSDAQHAIAPDGQGGYVVDASLLLREINQELGWQLPSHGPRTLNGLILEHLEFIPDANVGLEIAGYRIEITAVRDNAVRRARITRRPEAPSADDL